jgi:2-polyprenyl-6-hydroxyphenyl methylase / 3-demethylubiquinone-9 3-methyltransferase
MSSTAATATAAATTGEVAKFEGMSAEWWDPRRNPLISMNVLRSQFIEDCVRRNSRSSSTSSTTSREATSCRTALDVGCGGGLLSESLARMTMTTTMGTGVERTAAEAAFLFDRVVGIDPSPGQIKVARAHADSTLHDDVRRRIEYQACLLDQVAESSFDVVCCLEVIEHVPDPRAFVEQACQRLRPGGLLFISTINRTCKSYGVAIIGAEYVMRILPTGTHDWNRFVSPREVHSMLPPDVAEVKVAGMLLHPSPVSILRGNWQWKLDVNDTDVNWIGCYRKNS